MNEIRAFARRIGQEFRPERVVLFGSHARGSPMDDSDVDLLVVLPFKGDRVKQSVAIRMKLRPRFPVDLLVYTPEKVRSRLKMGDEFMLEVLEKGKVLYQADRR